jgi:hypothetical protein
MVSGSYRFLYGKQQPKLIFLFVRALLNHAFASSMLSKKLIVNLSLSNLYVSISPEIEAKIIAIQLFRVLVTRAFNLHF